MPETETNTRPSAGDNAAPARGLTFRRREVAEILDVATTARVVVVVVVVAMVSDN